MTEPSERGDLSITALYTSETWRWAGFEAAELLATSEGRAVFRVTNAFMAVARLVRWGFPSLRHSLGQRHAIIDALLEESGATQVLEIAAGLSRRGAAFSADPALRYVELDLPHVVDKKRELLERTEAGRAVAARDNFQIVAGDANETDLDALLAPGRPACVIAEGLLMYLDAAAQRDLWARVADALCTRPGSRFVFDLVPFCEQPKPGIVGRSLEWLLKRFTKGKSLELDDRTREDVVAELVGCGFTDVEVHEPGASRFELPFATKRTQVLVFGCGVPARLGPPAG